MTTIFVIIALVLLILWYIRKALLQRKVTLSPLLEGVATLLPGVLIKRKQTHLMEVVCNYGKIQIREANHEVAVKIDIATPINFTPVNEKIILSSSISPQEILQSINLATDNYMEEYRNKDLRLGLSFIDLIKEESSIETVICAATKLYIALNLLQLNIFIVRINADEQRLKIAKQIVAHLQELCNYLIEHKIDIQRIIPIIDTNKKISTSFLDLIEDTYHRIEDFGTSKPQLKEVFDTINPEDFRKRYAQEVLNRDV